MPPNSSYSYDIALTVTLPSKAKRYDAETCNRIYTPIYKELLRNCKHTSVIELTSNFDIHFHAILKIPVNSCAGKHPLRYIKDIFRSQFGYTCVKEVTDFEIWCKYLQKDVIDTNKVLSPVIRDDYDIFEDFNFMPQD